MTKFCRKSSTCYLSYQFPSDKSFFGEIFHKRFNSFQASVPILPPENTRKPSVFFMSGVSKGYKMELFARNRLSKNAPCIIHLTQNHFCYLLVKLFEITSYLILAKDIYRSQISFSKISTSSFFLWVLAF